MHFQRLPEYGPTHTRLQSFVDVGRGICELGPWVDYRGICVRLGPWYMYGKQLGLVLHAKLGEYRCTKYVRHEWELKYVQESAERELVACATVGLFSRGTW